MEDTLGLRRAESFHTAAVALDNAYAQLSFVLRFPYPFKQAILMYFSI